jgi:signal transduction histidine kinase
MVIKIVDNGSTAPISSRRSGLANLRRRATLRGGALSFSREGGETILRWSAILDL